MPAFNQLLNQARLAVVAGTKFSPGQRAYNVLNAHRAGDPELVRYACATLVHSVIGNMGFTSDAAFRDEATQAQALEALDRLQHLARR